MQPALGEHSCIYFLHPRVTSASRWPLCVRPLCSCLVFVALPRGRCFVPCQQFSPSLSLHIQDVPFTKQEPASPTHTHPPSLRSLGLYEKTRTYSFCQRRYNTETELIVCPLVLPYMLFLLMHDRIRSVCWKSWNLLHRLCIEPLGDFARSKFKKISFFLLTYFRGIKGSSVILIRGHRRIIQGARRFENVRSVLHTGGVSSPIQSKVMYIHRISPLGETRRWNSDCLPGQPATAAHYKLEKEGVTAVRTPVKS